MFGNAPSGVGIGAGAGTAAGFNSIGARAGAVFVWMGAGAGAAAVLVSTALFWGAASPSVSFKPVKGLKPSLERGSSSAIGSSVSESNPNAAVFAGCGLAGAAAIVSAVG